MKRVKVRRLTRRGLLKRGAILGAGIATVRFATPVSGAGPTKLVVYSPTLYGPIFQRTAAKVMREKFNVDVICQDSNGSEMISKLKASAARPEASVACPDAGSYIVGQSAGMWDNFDLSKLTNLSAVQDFAKSPPIYGKAHFAIANGSIGIQYHTKVFLKNGWAPPRAWKDLARPEFKGHVGLTSTVSGVGVAQLSFWSRMAGAKRGDIAPGIKFAKDLVDAGQIHVFPDRSSEVNELMEREEIWVATQWMEGALQGAAKGAPFGWVFPSEGTYLFPTGISLVHNGPAPAAMSNEFVNLVLSKETQQELVLDRWIIPVRTDVVVPKQYADKLPLTPARAKAIKARMADFTEFAEFRDQWHNAWIKQVERK